MQKTISFLETYAKSVLRLGLVAVILWFSLEQFLHNPVWTAYVPDYIVNISHMSAGTIVFFNAMFELVFGILLAFGWQTRIVALLLSLHLFDIMWTIGYGEIGVRDFGLAIATLVIFMNGSDPLCIQQKKRKSQQIISAIPKVYQPSVRADYSTPSANSIGKQIDKPIDRPKVTITDSVRPPRRFV